MTALHFRPARQDEARLLDEMTIAGAKSYGYQEEFPEALAGLAADLEEHDISSSTVFVVEDEDEVVAFYELVDREEYIELLRMFQKVDRIGTGLGRLMWDHCVSTARSKADRMMIISDPGATGFYERMGAEREKTFEPVPRFHLGVFWYDLPSGE